MATNKIYIVVKDGEELKELKSLAAAKKLADAEDATVVCNGATVYPDTLDAAEQERCRWIKGPVPEVYLTAK